MFSSISAFDKDLRHPWWPIGRAEDHLWSLGSMANAVTVTSRRSRTASLVLLRTQRPPGINNFRFLWINDHGIRDVPI